MFENLQGVNNSITRQDQKNKQSAPTHATYIQIIGSHNDTEIEYRVYLGGNNTSDFNIYRNKQYNYMIDIRGDNEVDTRVKSIYLTQSTFRSSYQVGEAATSTIDMICPTSGTHQYSIAYYLDEGDGDVFLNGIKQRQGVFIPFLNFGDLSKSCTLTYVQNSVSAVRLRMVYKDEDNFSFSRELTTNYVTPVLTLSDAVSTESVGGEASTISFTISKDGYTGGVSYKYEMLLGAGTVRAGSIALTENEYRSCNLGKRSILFTPTTASNATIRITVLLDNGETIYKNINIKVSKTTVTVTRTNGNGVVFSVSDPKWLNSTTKKYSLPSDFGATLTLTLYRDWNSQYNRQIINHSIAPQGTMELLETNGSISTWSGLLSESLNGYVATYRFDVSTSGGVGKFYTLVINK